MLLNSFCINKVWPNSAHHTKTMYKHLSSLRNGSVLNISNYLATDFAWVGIPLVFSLACCVFVPSLGPPISNVLQKRSRSCSFGHTYEELKTLPPRHKQTHMYCLWLYAALVPVSCEKNWFGLNWIVIKLKSYCFF